MTAYRAETRKRRQDKDSHSTTTRDQPKRRRGEDHEKQPDHKKGIYVEFGARQVRLENPYHNMVGYAIRKGLEDNVESGPKFK